MRTLLGRHSNIYEIKRETSLFVRSRSSFKRALIMWRWGLKARKAGNQRWVEKTPNHIFHIGKMLSERPDARVIIMVRDGRDVACSLRKRGVVWGSYSNDFSGGVQKWLDTIQLALEFKDRAYTVRYEDLVENPESVMHDLTTFLGESFEPQMLQGVESPRYGSSTGVENAEYRIWQAGQPVYDGRGAWRQEMSSDEKEYFKKVAGDQLIELDYAKDMNW